MPNYIAKYRPYIQTCLKNYPSLKKPFEKKKNYILQGPLQLGEPLKGNLNGLRSFPLQKNFIIIYLVCEECRRLKLESSYQCAACGKIPDNSVIFLLFGPHDEAYYSDAPQQREKLKDASSKDIPPEAGK
jgi:mRNA-degrading endonuclease YafQ of YafQ-DinJ toxin-antitoxin module